ncbi:MAG: UMP kinase [Thermoplasmatales archaeon]
MTVPVISLGGSIFSKDGQVYLDEFIERIRDEGSYAIIVGGGPLAREKIAWLRKMGVGEYQLDIVGIHFTRINALSLSLALGGLVEIPETINSAVRDLQLYGKVVMGGTEPGHTTDAVSLLLAEAIGAKSVVNVTDIDALYDRRPGIPGAKKIRSASFSDVAAMILAEKRGAGSNFPIDALSLNIAQRSNITIKIVSFKDMDNVFACLMGKKFNGTAIGTPKV